MYDKGAERAEKPLKFDDVELAGEEINIDSKADTKDPNSLSWGPTVLLV